MNLNDNGHKGVIVAVKFYRLFSIVSFVVIFLPNLVAAENFLNNQEPAQKPIEIESPVPTVPETPNEVIKQETPDAVVVPKPVINEIVVEQPIVAAAQAKPVIAKIPTKNNFRAISGIPTVKTPAIVDDINKVDFPANSFFDPSNSKSPYLSYLIQNILPSLIVMFILAVLALTTYKYVQITKSETQKIF